MQRPAKRKLAVSLGKAGRASDSTGSSGPAGAATRPATLHAVQLTFSPRPQSRLHARAEAERAHRIESDPFWRIRTRPTAV